MKPGISKICAFACLFHALSSYSQECSTQENVKVTFFGYPDNSPPGPELAFSCGPRELIAGGTGTYGDPVSFAAASDGVFKPCEIVYLPLIQKYARYEDDCARCKTEFDNEGKTHIDVWLGSSTFNGGSTQIACENSLSPKDLQTIIRHPGQILKVDSQPLFENGICHTDQTYTDPDPSSLCFGAGIPGVPTHPSRRPLPCLEIITSIITVTQYPEPTAPTKPSPSHSEPPPTPSLSPNSAPSNPQAPKSPTTSSSKPPTANPAKSPLPTLSSSPKAAQSSAATCAWPGHCEGATCKDYNDCADALICTDRKCTPTD